MNKKTLYLLLAVIGFLGPNYFVLMHGLETGNWLLYTNIPLTFTLAFANDVSTAFLVDLMLVVLVFCFWMFPDARRREVPRPWLYLLLTMAFGLAFGWPLYLYARET